MKKVNAYMAKADAWSAMPDGPESDAALISELERMWYALTREEQREVRRLISALPPPPKEPQA